MWYKKIPMFARSAFKQYLILNVTIIYDFLCSNTLENHICNEFEVLWIRLEFGPKLPKRRKISNNECNN